MAALVWDQVGERFFEAGVSNGVLYVQDNLGAYPLGVAWSGLTGVTDKPSGAEPNPQYADNIKYLELSGAEEYGLTIEAFTYPDEFAECDGSVEVKPGLMIGQQPRKKFGFVWKTKIGNDTMGQDLGYKLHLAYGCLAAASEKAYVTVNESPEASAFSWEVTTTPVSAGNNLKPTSKLTIDSTKVDAAKLAAFEKVLFGDAAIEAKLPLPAEVITTFNTAG